LLLPNTRPLGLRKLKIRQTFSILSRWNSPFDTQVRNSGIIDLNGTRFLADKPSKFFLHYEGQVGYGNVAVQQYHAFQDYFPFTIMAS